jgi:hypothetical protein
MDTNQALVQQQQQQNALAQMPAELTVEDILKQMTKIQQVMKQAMREGEHYGIIPGTERKDKEGKDISKRTLLKPGAEKLCLLFRLDPQYDSTETFFPDGHLHVKSKCTLYHLTTGIRVGSGEGSCTTKESKYAFRNEARKCPLCGKETIIKGKAEYGGGWICYKKKDGCGAKFADDSPEIINQEVGKIGNENLPDQYNTILKMANKRALIAAVLNATAASDIFTQDLEDLEANRVAAGIAAEMETKAETKADITTREHVNGEAVPESNPLQSPASKDKLINEDVHVPFGFMKGKPLKDCAPDQLKSAIKWAENHGRYPEWVRAAKAYLDDRGLPF